VAGIHHRSTLQLWHRYVCSLTATPNSEIIIKRSLHVQSERDCRDRPHLVSDTSGDHWCNVGLVSDATPRRQLPRTPQTLIYTCKIKVMEALRAILAHLADPGIRYSFAGARYQQVSDAKDTGNQIFGRMQNMMSHAPTYMSDMNWHACLCV
jgi:hypothetical protein